jgi:ABC-type transport system involved in multi-copper enzyme maturation permease subunit
MAVLIQPDLTNPIEWQEVRFQHKAVSGFMQRYWLIAPAALGMAIGLIVLSLRNVTSPTRDVAIYLIWVVHALVAARTIAAAGNAISREHDGKTWDILVMTGIEARQILIGKWLGVLRQVAPWMLGLGVLRLAMIPVFTLSLLNRFAWWTTRGGSYYNVGPLYEFPSVSWSAAGPFLAVGMTVVLTVLEVMACAALGLATSAVSRRGWMAMVTAFMLRFAPVLIFAAFTRYEVGNAPSWRILRFAPLAIGDSGTSPLYQLSLPITTWTTTAHQNALPGLLGATLLLIAILGISLWAASRAIRQSGALTTVEAQQT